MRFNRRNKTDNPYSINIWPAFTDIMTNFALVVFFLMLLSFVQNIVSLHNLQGILKVRETVSKELQSVFSEEIEAGKISVSNQGVIEIKEDIVFDLNKYELKYEGKQLLQKLAHQISIAMENKEFSENVSMIAIEGHTDSTGSPDHNWDLSTRRATEVVKYMSACEPKLRDEEFAKLIGAVGYSQYRFKADNTSELGRQKNRRIEIKIYLKEDKLISNISNF